MNIPPDCLVVEHTSGVWSYHLARKERLGLSLCGKPTMHTGISVWGMKSANDHMSYKWCLRCSKFAMPRGTIGLGTRITEKRIEKGWDQVGLARRAGLSSSSISEIENGQTNPLGPTLVKLSHALGVSIHYILTGESQLRMEDVAMPDELAGLVREEGIPLADIELLLYVDGRTETRWGEGALKPLSAAQWTTRYNKFKELIGGP